MKILNECPECDNKQVLSKKDIRPLTKSEKESTLQLNKELDKLRENKVINWPWFWELKTVKQPHSIFTRPIIRYGVLKCIVCNKESYLVTRK